MTESGARTELVAGISRGQAVAMVIGSMIGSGIFIVPADMVRQVQHPGLVLLAWAVAGVILVAGGLTYSELGAMYPRAGGLYVYLREGISPLIGFLYGWTLFAVIWTGGVASTAVGFARFAGVVFPAISPEVFLGGVVNLPTGPITVGLSPQRLVAVGCIVVATVINLRGTATTAWVQTLFTIIKVAAMLAILGLGLTIGRNPAALAANFGTDFWPVGSLAPLLPAFGLALIGPLFTMDGWYALCFAASELKQGAKNLPFALTAGTAFTATLFLLINVAYLSVLPAAAIAGAAEDRVASAVMEGVFGPIGGKLMAGAIMISAFGLVIGLVLGGARVFYAMAVDGVFLRAAGAIDPVRRVPRNALLLQATWMSLLCLSGSYAQLIDYTTAASLLFALLIPVALFVLRRRQPGLARTAPVPGYPLIPLFYTLASAWVLVAMVWQRPTYTWPGLVIVGLGIPIYYASKRRR
ncbi:MAG: amino acid permease [Gemmatimonadetes bacterium]|nr:amino acid permease [Gemmatimonadota bacterium]